MSFLQRVNEEYERASQKHPNFPSLHHGLSVIWEEFEELKTEIFKKEPDLENLKSELTQIAAMCYRFDKDLLQTQAVNSKIIAVTEIFNDNEPDLYYVDMSQLDPSIYVHRELLQALEEGEKYCSLCDEEADEDLKSLVETLPQEAFFEEGPQNLHAAIILLLQFDA